MSDVYRICTQCGNRTTETSNRFCPACGADSDTELAINESSLTVAATKAALPIVVGVATFALRFGWKLIQSRVAMSAPHNATSITSLSPKRSQSKRTGVDKVHSDKGQLDKKSNRRIHIRSAWATGDSDGNWQKGESEHIIDIDD